MYCSVYRDDVPWIRNCSVYPVLAHMSQSLTCKVNVTQSIQWSVSELLLFSQRPDGEPQGEGSGM